MIYRLTLFYRQHSRGWTEQYYRAAGDGRSASDLGDVHQVAVWTAGRARHTVLDAVRAEAVDAIGRIYLRLYRSSAPELAAAPDVAAVSATTWIPWLGGGRHLWLRGLPDDQVRRDQLGRPRPGPALSQWISRLNTRVQELGLLGQALTPAASRPHGEVLRLGAHPAEADWTRVTVWGEWPQPRVGDWVHFGGRDPGCPVARWEPYLVVETSDSGLSIWNPWPQDLRDTEPQDLRVQATVYHYPRLGELEFRDFTKHSTRRAYVLGSWVPTEEHPQRPVLHPCGRGVDMIGGAYRALQRQYRDDPGILVPVHWYPVEPSLPALDLEHPFGSRQWRLCEPPPILGELPTPRRRAGGGDPVQLKGQGLCGSVQQWYYGASAADPARPVNPTTGQPCCCGKGVLQLAGGGAGGGAAQIGLELGGGGAGGGFPFAALVDGGGAGGGLGGAIVLDGGGAGGGKGLLALDGGGAGGGLGQVLTDGGGAGGDVGAVPEDLDGGGAGGGEAIPVTTLCSVAAPSPLRWRFPLAGVTDDTCDECALFNRDWLLNHDPDELSGCLWASDVMPACGFQFFWILSYIAFAVEWSLVLGRVGFGGSILDYRAAGAAWVPLGPNTMSLAFGGGFCVGWPATLTLTAAD